MGSQRREFSPEYKDEAVKMTGLRVWAAGYAADEAAVELLAAVAHDVPAVLDPAPVIGSPWLAPCPRPGVWCLDGGALAESVELFPARLRPVILAIAGLVTDGAEIGVGVTLAGVPVEWLGPVFTALAWAAGLPRPLLVVTDTAAPLLTGLDAAA